MGRRPPASAGGFRLFWVYGVRVSPVLAVSLALSLACAGRTVHEQVVAAVDIEVRCGPSDEDVQVGTGVAVSDRLVVTALHVVTCDGGAEPQVLVDQGSGVAVPGRVEVELPEIDVARVVVPPGSLSASRVSVGPRPRVGDGHLTVVTAEPVWQVKECVPQPDQPLGSDSPAGAIGVGCLIVPGNSGAGVYDSRGMLVGVISQTAESLQFGIVAPLQGEPWITAAPAGVGTP